MPTRRAGSLASGFGRVLAVVALSGCSAFSGDPQGFPDFDLSGWWEESPARDSGFVSVAELRRRDTAKAESPSPVEEETSWLRIFRFDNGEERSAVASVVGADGGMTETTAVPETVGDLSADIIPVEPDGSASSAPAAPTAAPDQEAEDGPVPAPLPLTVPTPAPVVEQPIWSARRGETLRQVLERWAEKAEWRLAWEARWDYPVRANASFAGGFVQAAGGVVRAFARVVPAPYADFYPDNRVVVVSTQETENVR